MNMAGPTSKTGVYGIPTGIGKSKARQSWPRDYIKCIQYGRHTASSSLAVVPMLVGELLWLPSASTTSLWLGRLGLRSVDPVEALVQGGWMRGGDRSPPEIMEN